ncbi:MAG: ATP-dependent DNA helicase RecG [Deltaproteobacteria bacterium RBG_19FT_COMBO_60_16]|nr:MAG: ATP-dependent DNA helicase RecG [Deltaproteobacteria bacterium RBG_16_64_85]OGP99871.1 MAG: ATP-dependent DNA helicase RecG [Deltaproteobacteria bacterium RBG_19FT_COMBO_60_16]
MTDIPSIQFVKGVGPRFAERLASRGIRTPQDALFFFPKGYEDRRQLLPLRALKPGMTVPVKGTVVGVHGGHRKFGGAKVFEVVLSDGTGRLSAKWFHYHPSLKERFKVGETVIFCGTVRFFQFQPEMHHPEILGKAEEHDPVHIGRIVPVYPEVEGLPPRVLRRIQWEVVQHYASAVKEFFPRWMLEEAGVPPIHESLATLHFPPPGADASTLLSFSSPAQQRLIFGELFYIQWAMAKRRAGVMKEAAIPLHWDKEIVDEIKRRLPFTLTGAQRRVVNEILKDLSNSCPMHRLLQGDVGSGKTIVAWIAALVAWRKGAQTALMAPTEILAEQHCRRFLTLCRGLPVRIVLLTSFLTGKRRESLRKEIREGEAHIVIGTHALIQEGVEFHRLGLGIVDEQHRFGVLQRAALRGKAKTAPHLLVMTATPIPRTLAMTLYGDLDVSVIDEMPPGRTAVETKVVGEENRKSAWARVRKELAEGGRVYIVLPLVEESEKLTLRDATRTAERVREAFPEIGVGLLHGRMKAEEKDAEMRRFQEGEIRILVSTTVVEVGIDVPEATVMMIEHAERFGLSQLHQLRGRVGRGTRPSVCFLFVEGPQGEDAVARLSVMEKTTDGFKIAEEDLKIRGPGDFAGVRQSGIPDLVFSDIVRDARMLSRSREIANALLVRDPGLSHPEHAALARWIASKEAAVPTIG